MGFSSYRWQFIIFLCLFLRSGTSCEEKLSSTHQNEMKGNQQKRMLFSVFTTHKDSIPEINQPPTTTTPPTPITNPTYPPGPISASPTTIPPTPISTMPTSPITTPTNPTTTPTTPTTTPTSPTTTKGPGSSGGSWCIASQTASETALQVALDYACGYGGADCSPIQASGSCYNPNTVRNHASYAFNEYYQKNPSPTSCAFGGSAQLTNTDPSNGGCHLASSKSSTTSLTTPPASPIFKTPPASPGTPTMPTMTTPTGSTSSIYGSEPTGNPSSAPFASYGTIMLFSTTGLVGSIISMFYL